MSQEDYQLAISLEECKQMALKKGLPQTFNAIDKAIKKLGWEQSGKDKRVNHAKL